MKSLKMSRKKNNKVKEIYETLEDYSGNIIVPLWNCHLKTKGSGECLIKDIKSLPIWFMTK